MPPNIVQNFLHESTIQHFLVFTIPFLSNNRNALPMHSGACTPPLHTFGVQGALQRPQRINHKDLMHMYTENLLGAERPGLNGFPR